MRNHFLPVLLPLLLFLTACSSYDRDFKQAALAPTAADPTGVWEGRWESHTGHAGRLRCILERTAPDRYRARYDAFYQEVLNFKQTVDMTPAVPATHANDGLHLTGQSDLGWPFGVYTYDTLITPTTFDSTYESSNDHGVFHLHRPPPPQK